MVEPVSLDQLKKQLEILPADVSEDEFLDSLLLAARRACEKRTGASVAGDAPTLTDPADVAVFGQAVKMLATHWYTNREAAVPGQTVSVEMPLAVQWLLDPYRVLVV